MPFITTQIDLEGVVLSETSQRGETNTVWFNSSMEGGPNQPTNQLEKKQQKTDYSNRKNGGGAGKSCKRHPWYGGVWKLLELIIM